MSQPKHTPGPWSVSHGANMYPSIGSYTTHTKVCDLPSDMTGDQESDAEVSANANLIAAAPDLLAALERWQDEWVVNGTPAQSANNYSIELQIQAAIAKAKGGSNG